MGRVVGRIASGVDGLRGVHRPAKSRLEDKIGAFFKITLRKTIRYLGLTPSYFHLHTFIRYFIRHQPGEVEADVFPSRGQDLQVQKILQELPEEKSGNSEGRYFLQLLLIAHDDENVAVLDNEVRLGNINRPLGDELPDGDDLDAELIA